MLVHHLHLFATDADANGKLLVDATVDFWQNADNACTGNRMTGSRRTTCAVR